METLVDMGNDDYYPMDVVMDITGLTEKEIRSCSIVVEVELVYADC